MARWVAVEGLGAGFLAVVACALAAVTVALSLCVMHFRKYDKARSNISGRGDSMESATGALRSFTPAGRAIMNSSSSKRLLVAKNVGRDEEEGLTAYDHATTEERESLWQRNILMGERCQPPEFSGLIIYDNMGNRIPKFPPKSPSHFMATLPVK